MRRHALMPCLFTLAALAAPGAAFAAKPKFTMPSTPATQITATSARLSAIIASDKVPWSFRVEVGRTTSYGFTTKTYTSSTKVPVEAWVTIYGMAPSATYHFRFVATNSEGTVNGPDRSFATLASAGPAAGELLSEDPPPDPVPAPDPVVAPPPDPSPSPVPSDPLAMPDLLPPLTPGATDPAASSAASGSAPVLLPHASTSVVAGAVAGTVSLQAPDGGPFTPLSGAARVPVGSVIDARRGTIELSADTGANVDTGRFWGTVFRVNQPANAGGAAELTLLGGRPARCARKDGAADAAKTSGGGTGLWGKDKQGHFRTRGRNSVATVRGTVWYVGERCAGTVTRVFRGAVSVRDTRTGRTVLVKAGHHLMVRDHARAAKRAG